MDEIEDKKDEFDEEEEQTINIRVQENTLNDEIMVFIPADCWDLDNIGEAIKRAVNVILASIPDKLDG